MTAPREWADKDFYADLGVSSTASAEEIKKAYRKLARENHPDNNPGDTKAEDRFKKAATAYDVVGDAEKRTQYDELKSMLRSGGGYGGGFGGSGGAGFPGGFRTTTSTEDFFGGGRPGGGSAADSGFSDLFGGLFNRGGGPTRSTRPKRGADVETDVTLDFREAAKGTTIPLQLSGEAPCTTCHGSGSRSGNPTTCDNCGGSGFVNQQQGAFGLSQPCSKCGATGQVITDPCPTCSGSGTVHRTRSITVRVPAGVIDGQKVRLAGQGEAGPNGTPAGDLFVTVHVSSDKIFTREGDDLEVTIPVSFSELALGGTVRVPTLDDPVKVKIPAGTPDGRTLRVRGRGVPKRGNKAGDLMVTVQVKVPDNLDAAATSALRAYAQAEKDSGFNPRQGWV